MERAGVAPLDYDLAYGYTDHGQLGTITTDHDAGSPAKVHTYMYNETGDSSIWTDRFSGDAGAAPALTLSRDFQAARYAVASVRLKDPAGVPYAEQSYGYQPSGRRADHIINLSGNAPWSSYRSYNYAYNGRGEITSAQDIAYPSNNRAYGYDAIGNRSDASDGDTDPVGAPFTDGTVTDYTSNLNQYTGIDPGSGNTVTRVHDADGNLTDDGTYTYTWDAENRLVSVRAKDVPGAYWEQGFDAEYDYRGRRVRRVESGSYYGGFLTYLNRDEVFVYDGWNPVVAYRQNYHSSPPNADRYTWGIDLSGSLQGAGGVGGLLALSTVHGSSGTVSAYYYAADANGNVTDMVTSTGGDVVAHYEYDPYGRTVVEHGLWPVVNTNRFKFASKIRDECAWTPMSGGSATNYLDLDYYGHRYYDPQTGRWPSRDPIGERGGLNLYGFVFNSPTGWIDVLGGIGMEVTIHPEPGRHQSDVRNADGKVVIKKGTVDWGEAQVAKSMKARGHSLTRRGVPYEIFEATGISHANTLLKGCKDCIETLHIEGHGSAAVQRIGSVHSKNEKDTVMFSDPALPVVHPVRSSGIKELFRGVEFCKLCEIVLHGCFSGAGNNGQAFLNKIRDESGGCVVKAWDRTCFAKGAKRAGAHSSPAHEPIHPNRRSTPKQ